MFARPRRGCSRTRPALHAMLVVTGGSAWPAGAPTIFDAPYQSYLFDLIDGPDNWYLVRAGAGRPRHRLRRASRRTASPTRRPSSCGRPATRRRPTPAAWSAWASPTARRLVGPDARDAVRRAVEALARATRLAPLPPERGGRRRASTRARSASPSTRRPAAAGAAPPRPTAPAGASVASCAARNRCETRLQPTRRGGTIQSPRGTGTGLGVSRTPTRRHPRCRRGKGGLPGGRVARRARGERRAPGGRRRAETSPRPGDPGGSRPHRDARGLRHQPVRRVHRPRRRPGREELHDAGGPGRRRERHDDRGDDRRATARCTRSRTRSGRSTASSAASARPG